MIRLLTEPTTEGREDLALYRSRGGYQGLERLRTQGGGAAIALIREAGLRGRGGSGQGPVTADKWAKVARSGNQTRYVIANGAESSPVSQKDRFLMRHYPHRVLEGLLLAAHAVSAKEGYIFVRGDADDAVASMEQAVAEAREAGLLGGLELHVQPSVPTYISGEETAVIDALEGLEGLPQPKPPTPEELGLRGCPTAVNNVETLAAAAAILRLGADRFRAAGTPDAPGTALFTVSGDVERPGVYEVEYGTSLRQLLSLAGAPASDELLAVLPGGLSSGPLHPDELDVELSYEGLTGVGSTVGAAAAVVLRKGTSLAQFASETAAYLAESSCGQCRGCKDTTRKLAEALSARDAAGAAAIAELLMYGKGNCAHPTGTARFALRAVQAFPHEWGE